MNKKGSVAVEIRNAKPETRMKIILKLPKRSTIYRLWLHYPHLFLFKCVEKITYKRRWKERYKREEKEFVKKERKWVYSRISEGYVFSRTFWSFKVRALFVCWVPDYVSKSFTAEYVRLLLTKPPQNSPRKVQKIGKEFSWISEVKKMSDKRSVGIQYTI